MKVLVVLASYRPNRGDQGAYARRLAKQLRQQGHDVTLLVSDQERSPSREADEGVRVVVAPTLVQVDSFSFLPTLCLLAARLIRDHDVVNLHLPAWGAGCSAAWCRAARVPLVVTYHRDLMPPKGWLDSVVGLGVGLGTRVAGLLADQIVCSTEDFVPSSAFLQSLSAKISVISPPVAVTEVGEGAVAAFRKMQCLDDGGPVIGMAAQLAAENGVEVLLRALPRILEAYPEARILFAGQYRDVMGEEAYAKRLAPLFQKQEDHWTFLGVLRPVQMAAFYPNLDVIVVPSVDSTESFGLVQGEAMLCGTPSIASNLPGVRQPVEQTGMGEVVPAGDSEALAEAIVRVVRDREDYVRPAEEIQARWSPDRTARGYLELFEGLLEEGS